jgi:tetratricopeptide (TPR) repeat protein
MSSRCIPFLAPGLIIVLALGLGACGASRAPQTPVGQSSQTAPPAPAPGEAKPAAGAEPGTNIDPAAISAAVAKLRFRVSKDAKLLAVAGERSAPLPVENVFELAPARWSGDRSEVVVQYDDYCQETHSVRFSARALVAHLENAEALAAHRAGRHAEAAAGFTRAIALDPDFDPAYTNLASALTAAGKAEEAVAALQPLLSRNPVHVYALVMIDPGLAPLREQPAITALRSGAPGSAAIDPATFALAGAGANVAMDQTHARIAAVDSEASWGACSFESILEIFDAATGEVRASVPIVTWEDSDPDACDGRGLLPEARTRVAARVEAASRVLRDLGFVPVTKVKPSSGSEEAQGDRTVIDVPFPASRLSLVISDGTARVIRLGGAPARGPKAAPKPAPKPAPKLAPDQVLVERPVPAATAVGWALHVPEVDAVVYAWQRPGAEGCEGSDPTGIVVLPLSSGAKDAPAPAAAPGTP